MDDDVTINDSGEVAVIAGKIRVEIVRVAGEGGDQFRLRFEFPGEPLDVRQTCGREGRWSGKSWQGSWKGNPPSLQGDYCDACCDERDDP